MTEFEQKLQEGQSISTHPEIAFGVDLAREIWLAVWPVYGMGQYDVPINQISHDFNYALDVEAEEALRKVFERAWRKGLLYGYVTEDQGMVLPPDGKTDWMFLIDPVDGSRSASSGDENACVNIAISRETISEPTLSDVEIGIVCAIKERLVFIAKKGQGVYRVQPPLKKDGKLIEVRSKENITPNLKDCRIVYETYSMSNELMGIVVDPLLPEISFKTENPSGSYGALSLVRGGKDIDIDIRRRLILDYPYLNTMTKAGGKALSPMDIAPEFLMLEELGMRVTDGYGRPLNGARLWQFNPDGSWSSENQISLVAAVSPILHQKAMEKIEEGFAILSQKYPPQSI